MLLAWGPPSTRFPATELYDTPAFSRPQIACHLQGRALLGTEALERRLAERSAHPHAYAAGRDREPPASEPGRGHRGSSPGASRALVDRRDPRRIVRCLSLGAEKDRCVGRCRDFRGAAGDRGERHTNQRHHRRDRPRPGASGCRQSAGRIRANGGYEIGWSRLSDRVAGSRPSRQAICHGGTEEGGY